MHLYHFYLPLRRTKIMLASLLLSAAIVAVVGGFAYAILRSQTTHIEGNSITTASANIELSTDGMGYGSTVPGFNFANIVPGGAPVPADGHSVYVKNIGSTPLSLTLSSAPSLVNQDNVDLSKVYVLVTATQGSTEQFTLHDLVNTQNGVALSMPGGLQAGQVHMIKLQVAVDASVGQGLSLHNIRLSLSGALAN